MMSVVGLGIERLTPSAWSRYRLASWSETWLRHRLPPGAELFDGLTAHAFRELELPDTCRHGLGEAPPSVEGWCDQAAGCPHVFTPARVEAAVAADRAAVERFRLWNLKAAVRIAPFLDRFLADLDAVVMAARQRAAGAAWKVPGNDAEAYGAVLSRRMQTGAPRARRG